MIKVIDKYGKPRMINDFVGNNAEMLKKLGFARVYQGHLAHTKHVIAKLGGFGPGSNGGLINPGLIKQNGQYVGLMRCDKNFEGYHQRKSKAVCIPYWVGYDAAFNLIAAQPVILSNEYDGTLVEDFRVFTFRNEFYVAHSAWTEKGWQQWLSKLVDGKLQLVQKFDSPENREEKNWGFFVSHDKIYFIYSISPWVIYSYNPQTGAAIKIISQPYAPWHIPGMVSVSSLPVAYNNGFLVFVHSKNGHLYLHTAMYFDGATLLPKFFIPASIINGDDGAYYISSVIDDGHRLLLFGGEGEALKGFATAYTSVRCVDKEAFNNILFKNLNGLNNG